jgi:hypothetical protein
VRRNTYRSFVEKCEEKRDHLDELGADERI